MYGRNDRRPVQTWADGIAPIRTHCDKYDSLYRLLITRKRAAILYYYPDTGGNDMLMHNWYVGKQPTADLITTRYDNLSKRLLDRRGREYLRIISAMQTTAR